MATLLYNNHRLLLLLIGIITVAGLSSYSTMPRMEDPILVQRYGIVRTVFPGADADRVESQISRPLEEDIQTIKGIKHITSESMAGISTVTIELKEEVTDVDTVWSRVRDEISETTKSLPDEAHDPEFERPEMRSYASIVALQWTGDEQPNFTILTRLSEDLKAIIRALPGTESVAIFGKQKEEVLIEVPGENLHRLGVSIGNISQQIEQSESKRSAGMFRGEDSELVIELDQDLDSLERIGSTPIRYGSNELARLDEIARIKKGVKSPPDSMTIVDGKDSIVVAAFVRDESRIDLWNEDLYERLAEFTDSLPRGIELDVLFTQNIYVQDRLTQLAKNLLVGTLAVVIVVFLLMGWRSMIVVGVALPLSTLIVISGMRVLDIPIHQMSVTGLIIALGLLIDNAIVMVDEVGNGLREGKSPLEAITETIRQLGLPLFGSTLTTTLAFAPIVMLPGSSGEFVGSIAISVILAINASFLLAMTVIPALTALLFRPGKTQQGTIGDSTGYSSTSNRVQSGFLQRGIYSQFLLKVYRWLLVKLFHLPVLGVVIGFLLPVTGFYVSRSLPEQFFPPADREQFQIEMEMTASTTLAETRKTAAAIRDSVLKMDGVKRVHWFIGESSPAFFYNMMASRRNAAFYGQALVECEPGVNSREIIRKMQNKVDDEFVTCRVLVRQLEQGPPFKAPVEVKLFGPDIAILQKLGNKVRLILAETNEVVHTRADLNEIVPKLAVILDEYDVRKAGLSNHEIENQLYSSLEGLHSGSLIDGTEEIPIRVRTDSLTRQNTGDIATLELQSPHLHQPGSGFPLAAISELELGSEVAAITRRDGQRFNEVRAYITAGTLPDLVITEFKERLANSDFFLPPGYSLEYGGEAEKRDEAVNNLMANIPLLIALIIATLVASFRSFRVALVIALVGGLSIGLGLGSLWLFKFPFGFMGVVGTMGLVGVAVNDAIVVMAGIRDDPEARVGVPSAIAEIIIRRTRHILATTLTTIAGFIPLMLDDGGFWPPVATTIAGGVGGATLLALCFVPSVYLLFIGRAYPATYDPE
ncbi:MAG: efflux RND transporter permease subunit [Verrucomicrobiales bacterium]|nr:efflux RND transporter permease subunit [Verrucomicrobiales bacterium]